MVPERQKITWPCPGGGAGKTVGAGEPSTAMALVGESIAAQASNKAFVRPIPILISVPLFQIRNAPTLCRG